MSFVQALVDRARDIARQDGFYSLVRKLYVIALWSVLGKVLVNLMVRDFRRRASRAATVESAVDLALSYEYLGASFAPMQIKAEIVRLLEEVKALESRTILEIGTAKGGTLFLFSRIAAPDAVLVSVDLPGRMYGSAYPHWMSRLLHSFAKDDQEIILIRGDSHSEEILSRVKSALRSRQLDFLFIDGDHSYDGVRRDFEIYSPLVRKGGIIAFHDVCCGSPELVGGVPRFWNEIEVGSRTYTIISNPHQNVCGIGVILL